MRRPLAPCPHKQMRGERVARVCRRGDGRRAVQYLAIANRREIVPKRQIPPGRGPVNILDVEARWLVTLRLLGCARKIRGAEGLWPQFYRKSEEEKFKVIKSSE